jgi:VWFA-related protein
MRPIRLILVAFVSFVCLAQDEEPQTFRTTVNVVVAPVTVTDKNGRHVNGLEVTDFRLLDNDKIQDIRLDVSFLPISVVVCVHKDHTVESVLPKIQKIGPLLESLVVGEKGEVAVISFDHEVQLVQDFTSEGALVTKALQKIRPGSSSHRMIDAVIEAGRKLRRRPQNNRKVILLISTTCVMRCSRCSSRISRSIR